MSWTVSDLWCRPDVRGSRSRPRLPVNVVRGTHTKAVSSVYKTTRVSRRIRTSDRVRSELGPYFVDSLCVRSIITTPPWSRTVTRLSDASLSVSSVSPPWTERGREMGSQRRA